MKLFVSFSFALLALYAPVNAYSQLKNLKPEDFGQWSKLSQHNISPNGKWFTYKLEYNTADTLFVQELDGRLYTYPAANDGLFSDDSKVFIASDKSGNLLIQSLGKKHFEIIANLSRREFFNHGKSLAVLFRKDNIQQLLIYNVAANEMHYIENVSEFTISSEDKIAVIANNAIILADPLNGAKLRIDVPYKGKLKRLVWSRNSMALAFLQEYKEGAFIRHRLYHFNVKTKKLNLAVIPETDVFKGQYITDMQQTLAMDDDGSHVFFQIAADLPNDPAADFVNVWDTDFMEFNRHPYEDTPALSPKLTSWAPDANTFLQLGTNDHPHTFLTANRKNAFSFTISPYEPQYENKGFGDFFITNIESGFTKPFLQNQTTNDRIMGSSPKGNYLHYFREGNWWVYDISKETNRNLTENLPVSFANHQDGNQATDFGYFTPGWTSDESALLVYDDYDIWMLAPDGTKSTRITDGRVAKERYRICEQIYPGVSDQGKADVFARKFDLSKGLVLEMVASNYSSGFYQWFPNRKIKKMAFSDARNSDLRKAKHSDSFLYISQTAASPPKLSMLSKDTKKPAILLETNKQHHKYLWGATSLISYKNSKGNDLNGIIYYPAGYEKNKKYPMIVYIYEKLSHNFHQYYNPTMYNSIGFSHSNYTTDGYLILYPDIAYDIGTPGASALECVEAAVEKVKRMGVVDTARIGILGHSFGGFEVSYIITQTSMFAAAVAGASVTDLVSDYFSANIYSGLHKAWRYEKQQFRIGKSFFEDQKKYIANSAVYQAASVNTPLLSWAGKEDASIDWHQSLEFHLALRRLQKKNKLLVYPGQGHTLLDPQPQADLSNRIKEWFDHYLKAISEHGNEQ